MSNASTLVTLLGKSNYPLWETDQLTNARTTRIIDYVIEPAANKSLPPDQRNDRWFEIVIPDAPVPSQYQNANSATGMRAHSLTDLTDAQIEDLKFQRSIWLEKSAQLRKLQDRLLTFHERLVSSLTPALRPLARIYTTPHELFAHLQKTYAPDVSERQNEL